MRVKGPSSAWFTAIISAEESPMRVKEITQGGTIQEVIKSEPPHPG